MAGFPGVLPSCAPPVCPLSCLPAPLLSKALRSMAFSSGFGGTHTLLDHELLLLGKTCAYNHLLEVYFFFCDFSFPASLLLSHKWAFGFSLLIMQDDFYHIQFSMRSHWRVAGAIFFSLIQPVGCVVNSIKSHYLSPARTGSCELSKERPLLFSAQAQGARAPHTAPCYLGSHTGPRDPLHQGLFLPLTRPCPAR